MELKDIITGFKQLDTPCVTDAMDRLGIDGGLLHIKPVVDGTGRVICGPAFTVRYIPVGLDKKSAGDYQEDVPAGSVVVVDNGGRDSCTVWGDILSNYAVIKGFEGTVIDGVCRDVNVIRQLKYPIYTKGCYMMTGKDRVQMESTNVPVTISGLQVCPGDLIMCDDNGCVRIPKEKAEEILVIAREIEEKESFILDAVKAGSTLAAAREQWGYHNLQTKR